MYRVAGSSPIVHRCLSLESPLPASLEKSAVQLRCSPSLLVGFWGFFGGVEGECWFLGTQLPLWLKPFPKNSAAQASIRRDWREGIEIVDSVFLTLARFTFAQLPYLALPGTLAHDLFNRNLRGRPPALQHF